MRFTHVTGDTLHPAWPYVRRGLEKILERCPDSWIPEDVYFAIRSGKASLFIFPGGFYVAEVLTDPNNGSKKLNVWTLYTEPNQEENVRNAIIQSLDTLAAQAGCKATRFVSPRSGWGRYLASDFAEVARIYERSA